MKVLIVHPHMNLPGGAERLVTILSNYLSKNNVENTIATLSVSDAMQELCKELNIIMPKEKSKFMLRSTSFIKAVGSIKEVISLNKLVHENLEKYDIINLHNYPATWSLFPAKKKSVWMCNEPPDIYNNPNPSLPLKIITKIGKIIDKFIVNSSIKTICVADEFNAKRVLVRYGRNAEIINYGIDHEFFENGNSSEAIEKFNLKEHFVVLQVGMITPTKNQMESITAVNTLKNEIKNIKLVLAGYGVESYMKTINEYINNNSLREHVVFTGHISQETVRDLYHACDIAIFPTKSQGGWLSPFEALCAVKPIVISPSISSASIIEKANIGIVTTDFASAIRKIYKTPDEYKKTAQKGSIWVKENLSWDKYCEQMLEVFRKAVKIRNK